MSKPLFPDVVVNGQTIASAAIAAEAQNHAAPAGKPGLAWRAAARALAIRALLLQEAARLGLDPDPQLIDEGRRETDDDALIRALLETEAVPEDVTDAACRAVYDARPQAFRAPNLYDPAHILFAADPRDPGARKGARARAEAALDILARRPKAFSELAQENSDCPSKANGGSLGQIGSGETVPEFDAALETMAEGEISAAPVETRYGFHLIRLDAKAIGAQLPFEAVKAQIREKLEQIAWARAANALTGRLAAAARIEGVDLSRPAPRPARDPAPLAAAQ